MNDRPIFECPGCGKDIALDTPHAPTCPREPRSQAHQAALELAYGLLWLCPSDRATINGDRIYQARQALLATLDRDARLRGLKAAQDLTPAPGKMN